MITYQNNKLWQRPWFLVVVGCTAIAAATGWWMTHRTPNTQPASASAPSSGGWFSSNVGHHDASPAPTIAPTTPLLAEGRPTSIPEADWNALKGALGKLVPNPEAEAARVVDYLQYQKRFEYWQSTEGNKSPKERAALAKALLEEVPARLAQGEFTAAEAVLMNTVLISESEPNETIRQQRIAAMQEQLMKAAPPQDDAKKAQDEERAVEQKRLIATTFAEWRTRPDATRTQESLEAALLAAQRTFNAGGTP